MTRHQQVQVTKLQAHANDTGHIKSKVIFTCACTKKTMFLKNEVNSEIDLFTYCIYRTKKIKIACSW
jgi:hypothetical protein